MKLLDAQARIERLAYIPFKDYLSPEQVQDAMMIINKGKTGQLLELTIGLNLSNTTLDFEDGELKTNKCDRTGKPLETMFITQTASIIDDLLAKRNFEDTKLYEEEEMSSHLEFIFKEDEPYTIRRENDLWIIEGEEIEKLFNMTKFNEDEAVKRFARKLKGMGVEDKLESLGAKRGDEVSICGFIFEFKE